MVAVNTKRLRAGVNDAVEAGRHCRQHPDAITAAQTVLLQLQYC